MASFRRFQFSNLYIIISLAASTLAAQVSLPPVNLGGTSFVDAVAGPGLLIEPGVIEHYHANRFVDSRGNVIPGRNSVDSWANLVHVAYITNHRILGGFFGAELLLPLARVDVNTSFGPMDTQSGPGDVIVSPLLIEWPGRSLFGKPFFSRFVALAVLPTGSYSVNRAVNIGSNAGGAFAYYAFTLFPQQKWETSWRLNYLWNASNSEPFAPLGARSARAGQAVHLNYAPSYGALPSLRLGINGYLLRQLTDHRMGSSSIADSKEQVFAVGPGLVWTSGFWSVFGNLDVETFVRNRPQGYRMNLTLRRVFPRG